MYNTVVVPAFLLHVARPDHLPIIDQHTVRAFFALTRGEVQEKPKIDWEVWREYVAFFQKAAVDADCNHNREERCRVDHALFTWGKTLKSSARLLPGAEPPEPAKLKAEEKEPEMKPPLLWGQDIPRTGIVPTSANVLKASEEYVEAGSLNSLPPFKRQNLRDLHLHKFPQPDLRELIREPGGGAARKLLHYYKETMGGNADIMNLPRPIRDVFLVGWANCCGINGTTKNAKHLYKFRFGGTERAAMAVVAVGKSTGRLFGLLDDPDLSAAPAAPSSRRRPPKPTMPPLRQETCDGSASRARSMLAAETRFRSTDGTRASRSIPRGLRQSFLPRTSPTHCPLFARERSRFLRQLIDGTPNSL